MQPSSNLRPVAPGKNQCSEEQRQLHAAKRKEAPEALPSGAGPPAAR